MEVRRSNFLEHNFAPGFKVDLHHKDLGIALATGRTYGVPLPVTALVDQMLLGLKVKGQGALDHTALLTVIEEGAQHTIGAPE
jgi:2-hydroxy-3-oxopropionate reductase